MAAMVKLKAGLEVQKARRKWQNHSPSLLDPSSLVYFSIIPLKMSFTSLSSVRIENLHPQGENMRLQTGLLDVETDSVVEATVADVEDFFRSRIGKRILFLQGLL